MSEGHIEKQNQKKVEEAEFENRIYQDTSKALQTEERFVNFLKPYRPDSVEQFIKYYAQRKADWYAHADTFDKLRKSKQNQWKYFAVRELLEIYYKKLFDVICRWQAGEMDLEGITVSADFETWTDPHKAHAVQPITQQEFDCYYSFMNSEQAGAEDHDRASSLTALSFYHWYKCTGMTREAEEMIPRWFHYYDSHFGTAPLRQLPVKRRALEEDYNDIWTVEIFHKTLTAEQLKYTAFRSRQDRLAMEADPEKMKAWVEMSNRLYYERKRTQPQYISMSVYNHEKMDELVALIEPLEVRGLYKANSEWRRRSDGEEEVYGLMIHMRDVKENIPVESNENYREALKKAYDIYSAEKTLELLPLVFEEYSKALNSGEPFSWKTSEYDMGHSSSVAGERKKNLLAVLRLKGEPENFDFLKKENLPDKI